MRLILLLSAVLFFSVSCQAQPKNEFGLKVTSDIKQYKQEIKNNPILELVNLREYEGLFFDIKYATSENFTKEIIYPSAEAFARKQVATNLMRANKTFNERGLALKIFDAYRPYSATVKFYEIYRDTNYVASPYTGSRHNRGCAVDITLVDMETGEELPMPTAYDDFTEKSHPNFEDLPANLIANRDYLIETMQQFGFKVYPTEWWHFDFNGWEQFNLLDIKFEDLKEL